MRKIFFIVLILFNVFFLDEVKADVLCKRAKKLHTETCNAPVGFSKPGCLSGSSPMHNIGDTITYGKLGDFGVLNNGDAFDCDVNGDGIHSSDTERFYYVTDIDNDTAVLIYYSSVASGVPTDTESFDYAYRPTGTTPYNPTTFNGPEMALTQLPTTTQWKNVNIDLNRQIIDKDGNYAYDEKKFPTSSVYSGYAARLLTTQEIQKACDVDNITYNVRLDKCEYLYENTSYSTYDKINGVLLETPYGSSTTWVVDSSSAFLNNYYVNNPRGVKPVIEVSKEKIEIDKKIKLNSNKDNVYLFGMASVLSSYKFNIQELSNDSSEYKKLESAFNNKKIIDSYNLGLYNSNNEEVSLTSEVEVNVELSKNSDVKTLKVWNVSNDYKETEMEYLLENNVIKVNTSNLDTLVLTEDIEGEVVQVADTAFSITKLGVSIGLVILVLGVMVIVQTLLKDKQKNQ